MWVAPEGFAQAAGFEGAGWVEAVEFGAEVVALGEGV